MKLMGGFSFFKPPAHRQFDYYARHYDKRKEDLEAKKQLFAKSEDDLEEKDKVRIRMEYEMQKKWNRQDVSREIWRAQLRTALVILALLGLFFFLFYGMDYMDDILNKILS